MNTVVTRASCLCVFGLRVAATPWVLVMFWSCASTPSVTESPKATIDALPSVVQDYNEEIQDDSPPGEVEALVLGAVQAANERATNRSLTTDPRLGRLARQLGALGDSLPPTSLTEFLQYRIGLIDPVPHLIVVELSTSSGDDLTREIVRLAEPVLRAEGYTHVGVGLDDRSAGSAHHRIVIVLVKRAIEASTFPRTLPHRGETEFSFRLQGPYLTPRVLLSPRVGAVQTVRPRRDGNWFRAPVVCPEFDGVLQVEVLGDGPRGPTVLANFPVYCGVSPPTEPPQWAARMADEFDPVKIEARLLELTNAARAEHGLAPLAHHENAARLAREHSRDMLDQGYVGHHSATTGTPADRARRSGLQSVVLLENVARAYSSDEAHQSLLTSPGHRANILNDRVTHLGIGVAMRSQAKHAPEIYVTELFLRPVRNLTPAVARAELMAQIQNARTDAGRSHLEERPELRDLAQSFAERWSGSPTQRDRIRADLTHRLGSSSMGHRRVLVVLAVVKEPTQLESPDWLDDSVRSAGIGVSQGLDPEQGGRAFYVVLLLGKN